MYAYAMAKIRHRYSLGDDLNVDQMGMLDTLFNTGVITGDINDQIFLSPDPQGKILDLVSSGELDSAAANEILTAGRGVVSTPSVIAATPTTTTPTVASSLASLVQMVSPTGAKQTVPAAQKQALLNQGWNIVPNTTTSQQLTNFFNQNKTAILLIGGGILLLSAFGGGYTVRRR